MEFLILSCSTKDPLGDPDALLARSSRTYRDEFNRTFANGLLLTSSPFLLEIPLSRIIFLGPKNCTVFRARRRRDSRSSNIDFTSYYEPTSILVLRLLFKNLSSSRSNIPGSRNTHYLISASRSPSTSPSSLINIDSTLDARQRSQDVSHRNW